MRHKLANLMLAAGMLIPGMVRTGWAAPAANSSTYSDADIAAKLGHEVRMYVRYTIWDDIKFRVNEGNVELLGEVSQPFKKADLGRLAQHVPGVASVSNDIKVLPLSTFDDRLRIQVARALFRDPVLSRYAIQSVPPIHIIVDNDHVTLEGVVNSDLEKTVAGMRASGAGLSFGSVTNNLKVENPSHKG